MSLNPLFFGPSVRQPSGWQKLVMFKGRAKSWNKKKKRKKKTLYKRGKNGNYSCIHRFARRSLIIVLFDQVDTYLRAIAITRQERVYYMIKLNLYISVFFYNFTIVSQKSRFPEGPARTDSTKSRNYPICEFALILPT